MFGADAQALLARQFLLPSQCKQHARHAVLKHEAVVICVACEKGNASSPGLHILGLKERNKVLAEDSNMVPSLCLPRMPSTALVCTHDKLGRVCSIDNGSLSFSSCDHSFLLRSQTQLSRTRDGFFPSFGLRGARASLTFAAPIHAAMLCDRSKASPRLQQPLPITRRQP